MKDYLAAPWPDRSCDPEDVKELGYLRSSFPAPLAGAAWTASCRCCGAARCASCLCCSLFRLRRAGGNGLRFLRSGRIGNPTRGWCASGLAVLSRRRHLARSRSCRDARTAIKAGSVVAAIRHGLVVGVVNHHGVHAAHRGVLYAKCPPCQRPPSNPLSPYPYP